jgi:hypothetical protein
MLNLDSITLQAVADQALTDAAAYSRWVNAICHALAELDSNPYLERSGHGLIIGSPSGGVYAANGICQCTSYSGIDADGTRVHAGGKPCWHRAAARLVRLHDEAQAGAAAALADKVIAIVESTPATLARKRAAACTATALVNELFA